jgi:hypothetical protein
MLLPYGLTAKDLPGAIVSAIAALLSAAFAWKSAQAAKAAANRSIYVDGQKFLIEVCKQLVAEPVLWCLYDDSPLRNEAIYDANDPLQQAKLRAFAYLHLNMFEIIVNEVPKPSRWKWRRNASNVWYDYLHDTLDRSTMTRGILDEPTAEKIWSKALHKEYGRWKLKRRLEEEKLQKHLLMEMEKLKVSTPHPPDRK